MSTLLTRTHIVDGLALIPLHNGFELLIRERDLAKRGERAEEGYRIPRDITDEQIFSITFRGEYEMLPAMRPELVYDDSLHGRVEALAGDIAVAAE